MSPPEVWGPAVWTLFHTLTEKINENAYKKLYLQLFYFIVRICKNLPCPDCSNDASIFLAKIKPTDFKNKDDLKNFIYLFHNRVNYKKRKPLFNYANILVYQKYNTIQVVNNFIEKYQTKGNMKLLTESFQRKLLINEFKKWLKGVIVAFIPNLVIQNQLLLNNSNQAPLTVSDSLLTNDTDENNNVKEE